jgi:FeS assembly SUF system protein
MDEGQMTKDNEGQPSPAVAVEGEKMVVATADSAARTPPPQPSPGVPMEGDNHTAAGKPADAISAKLLEGKVIEVLQTIFDPEIPVNIHELGLIYVIDVQPDNSVLIKMTLTAPACPVAGTLPGEVEQKVNAIPEVKEAKVELVWDPPWTREMMSESALLTLGF